VTFLLSQWRTNRASNSPLLSVSHVTYVFLPVGRVHNESCCIHPAASYAQTSRGGALFAPSYSGRLGGRRVHLCTASCAASLHCRVRNGVFGGRPAHSAAVRRHPAPGHEAGLQLFTPVARRGTVSTRAPAAGWSRCRWPQPRAERRPSLMAGKTRNNQ
jgi:hypothetical protein